MTRLIIVRPGYSEGNKEKRFSGQMDTPLNEVGFAQAASTAKYILQNYAVDAVYASDLCRALDTVKPIAEILKIPLKARKDLREVDVGLWQGMLIEDVRKQFPESFDLYRRKPGLATFDGGESYALALERAERAIREIAEENEEKTVVIGTHGGVIRVLRAAWTGVTLENIESISHVPNASVTVAEYESGAVSLSLIGYCEHLTERTAEKVIQ